MQRILVIGCAGAGKTTLSRQLQDKLDLPVVHLDKIWWSPGNWEHLEQDAFDRALLLELEKPRWIIEGNYDRTLPMRLEHCDGVIWLDYNRIVCLTRWLKRMIFNWGKVRSDMAPGCFERFEWAFAKEIWKFNDTNRKKYETLFSVQSDKKIYRFKTQRQLKRYLESL